MNKLPWFKFFPGDWITGTREMSPQEKAAWIDLLAFMWKSDSRGSISGTWEGLARMLGLPWLDCETIITGMFRKNYINLTEANGIITLSSRRMAREEKVRESTRLRQKAFYKNKHNAESNANLTHKKSEVRSQKTDKDNNIVGVWFEEIWKRYPNKDGRKQAFRSFCGSVKEEADYRKIHQALSNYLKSRAVIRGFVKNGSTWFNNWQDWINYQEAPNAGTGIERPKSAIDYLIDRENGSFDGNARLD